MIVVVGNPCMLLFFLFSLTSRRMLGRKKGEGGRRRDAQPGVLVRNHMRLRPPPLEPGRADMSSVCMKGICGARCQPRWAPAPPTIERGRERQDRENKRERERERDP